MKKSIIRKLALGLILVLFTSEIYSQLADYYYQSPINGAKYINPEQTIVFKTNEGFNKKSIKTEDFKITGSRSGDIKFSTKISEDSKSLFIIPDKYFKYGEKVSVEIYPALKDNAGNSLKNKEFHFYIKNGETLSLLKKYRQSPEYDFYIPEPDKREVMERPTSSRENNLPLDYPAPTMSFGTNFSPDHKYILMNMVNRQDPVYKLYLTILDCYGTPIYYKRTVLSSRDLKVLPDGVLTYSNNDLVHPENEKYFLMDSSYVIFDSVMTGNGYNVDGHDMLLLDNGHYLMMSYDPEIVDMSLIVPGGNPAAVVTGLILQEVDLDRNVYFQWRSWDHFQITDAVYDISMIAPTIDYVHGNAFDIDTDGNILLSCRNMDEVTKINFNTGAIIWRFGLNSENNMFEISNDPLGFSHQHDVRRMSNGHYSVYDNGNNHTPQFSEALEYTINEQNLQATRVYHYQRAGVFAWATGDYRLLDDGKKIICWGTYSPLNVTELNPDNTVSFDLKLPVNITSYRAIKQPWKTNLFSSREELSLGNYAEYSSPKETFLYIHNNSANPINITSTYNMTEEFYVSSALPLMIPANGTKKITVDFNPAQEGSYSDRLTLNYDNLGNSIRIARQVDLSGIWDDSIPSVFFDPVFGAAGIPPDTAIGITFSEPVRKVFGGEINNMNIPQLIELRRTNYDGDPVPFTASISDDKTHISIFPENTLLQLQQYYVEVKAMVIADYSGNVISDAESSYFITGLATGMNEISAGPDQIFPNPFKDKLTISFADNEQHQISIFDLSGKCLIRKNITTAKIEVDIRTLNAGMYLLKISTPLNQSEKTYKIIKQDY